MYAAGGGGGGGGWVTADADARLSVSVIKHRWTDCQTMDLLSFIFGPFCLAMGSDEESGKMCAF